MDEIRAKCQNDITVDQQYGSATNGNKKAELTYFRRTSFPNPFKNDESAVK